MGLQERENYPDGVAGNEILEHVFDLGFTASALHMSQIFDLMILEYKDPKVVVEALASFFAVVNVRSVGGDKKDMIAVAELYGHDDMTQALRETTQFE